MDSGDDLGRLAEGLGIASAYLDQAGRRIDIPEATRVLLIEALGFPVGSASERRDSLQRVLQQRAGLLPPWIVLRDKQPQVIRAAHDLGDATWRVTGEDGRTLDGCGRLEVPALDPGYYTLEVSGGTAPVKSFLIVAPTRCWCAPAFRNGQLRGWGVTAQAYGFCSQRNFGIGDFEDIAALAQAAGGRGASFLGLSPLHALFTSDRGKISPYSPSSRLFLEPLYLALDALGLEADDLAPHREAIARLQDAKLVDYESVWALKRPLLETLYARFFAAGPPADFLEKRKALGPALDLHATFEALSEHFHSQGHVWPGVWPADYFDVSSAAVTRFRRDHAHRIAFHTWLQVLCDAQLDNAARRARKSGMELGLYRDLAVGADRFGSEVWTGPQHYALTLSVGAPPDPLGPQGQNWGFPPFNPFAMESREFLPFREMVRANMRHAGAIRIDHAFQLQRLFVVPPCMSARQGGYINFPLQALLAILRIESHRHCCMVIAEDLGTGPKGFSETIMESGLLSYRILSFERGRDGSFQPPQKYPANSLAAITTHDLPTFKGWRRGLDIDLRQHFGVYDETQARAEHQARENDLAHWRKAVDAQGLCAREKTDSSARNEAFLYLARTPCMLLAAQIEDILDESQQANLPGLSDGPPNWRRRISESIETLARDHSPLAKAGGLMAQAGRCPRGRRFMLAAPPPRATYRLQFHTGFTFDMARTILPYLKALGVSHLYASPIQKARAGSTHGYDIIDPREINPELGGRAGFEKLADAAHDLGLKIIVDIVPNHLAASPDNPFWLSLLQWGDAAPTAQVFDVDFQRAGGRIILPVLGAPLEELLARGEIQLDFDDAHGGIVLRYFEAVFPLCPHDIAPILRAAADLLRPHSHEAQALYLLGECFACLRSGPGDLQRPLHKLALYRASRTMGGVLRMALDSINSDPARLTKLIARQAYALAPWRSAASEINYRRFFEINTLAGVRAEDADVFGLTHATIVELSAEGHIDGLRIDHIDGLASPGAYLERLQERVGPGFYVIVEKILEPGEKLKAWPVSGTTGYEVLNEIDGLFVAREGLSELDAFYRMIAGADADYEEALNQSKAYVLDKSFGAECSALATGLAHLAFCAVQKTLDPQALERALKAFIAALPIYRLYIGAGRPTPDDMQVIEAALAKAGMRIERGDRPALDFIAHWLLRDMHEKSNAEAARLRIAFEQLSGPVMAKGLEDTLFYRHVRFLALNEVGGDPLRFGLSTSAFHAATASRAQDWPANLIATATHDTKRGEDARARLLAMSADPQGWIETARLICDEVEGIDCNDAYLLMQSLIAAWPLEYLQADRLPEAFVERARAFLRKALRESKRHSSWVDPDEAYEANAFRALDHMLDPEAGCYGALRDLVARHAWAGALNGLARTILKLTLPGVPDFYQGTELWDFSFVDPDNRRPVDFGLRQKHLQGFASARVHDLLPVWPDGRIKQFMISRLLDFRALHPDLFAYGSYEPLKLDRGIGYRRVYGEQELRVCLLTGTELSASNVLQRDGTIDAGAIWRDAKLELPSGLWRNLLTGETFAEGAHGCADLAGGLPWLVLGT